MALTVLFDLCGADWHLLGRVLVCGCRHRWPTRPRGLARIIPYALDLSADVVLESLRCSVRLVCSSRVVGTRAAALMLPWTFLEGASHGSSMGCVPVTCVIRHTATRSNGPCVGIKYLVVVVCLGSLATTSASPAVHRTYRASTLSEAAIDTSDTLVIRLLAEHVRVMTTSCASTMPPRMQCVVFLHTAVRQLWRWVCASCAPKAPLRVAFSAGVGRRVRWRRVVFFAPIRAQLLHCPPGHAMRLLEPRGLWGSRTGLRAHARICERVLCFSARCLPDRFAEPLVVSTSSEKALYAYRARAGSCRVKGRHV